MPTERIPGKPSTRRYTPAEREQAVRLVRQLRKELWTDQGTIARVAKQLGYGVESVRAWVNQADIDATATCLALRSPDHGLGSQNACRLLRSDL